MRRDEFPIVHEYCRREINNELNTIINEIKEFRDCNDFIDFEVGAINNIITIIEMHIKNF